MQGFSTCHNSSLAPVIEVSLSLAHERPYACHKLRRHVRWIHATRACFNACCIHATAQPFFCLRHKAEILINHNVLMVIMFRISKKLCEIARDLTVILAAIEGLGEVAGAEAVALAKLGEGHFGFGKKALNLHVKSHCQCPQILISSIIGPSVPPIVC